VTESNPLLVNVWREASRHIELAESTQTIIDLVRSQWPIRMILVRRFDQARPGLDTLAVGCVAEAARPAETKSELTKPQCDALETQFARKAVVTRVMAADDAMLAAVVPPDLGGDKIVGLLGRAEELTGVVVFVAQPDAHFDASHLAMAQLLIEPFSIALDNALRLREMVALREAAEAEKRSLLTKLGRKALADTVVGADSGLRSVMERVELVARSDVPVLIVGETGTGKELVARLIHNQSSRSAGPFIRVNCGAIPAELVDSQLFGHERGAFTGAVETRQGWFERADGGTLLLDELGELPLAAQVRLLRILQDGWLERVGGHSPIKVDVRIVTATNRDLAAMVADAQFRQDLWYRIAVFPIILPPLRERREDIAEMASHFAERAATRFVLPLALPTADDIELLKTYSWPGNIRELGAVIDRAAILGNGKRLEITKALGIGSLGGNLVSHDAPLPRERASSHAPPAAAQAERAASQTPGEILPLDEAMKQHIELALRATRGRIEGTFGAARILQINPHTLRARMRKLKIDWKLFRDGSEDE
jgi:transcriptional regulator with GAF, ATPase, and Fis domain